MAENPRIAFIHDWLTTWGGGEQVLEAMLEAVGPAPIYTTVWDPRAFRGSLIGKQEIHPSFLQRLPGARTNHRVFLPLMPLAVEQFGLRGYDILISSSHVVAHGILAQPDQLHISYTHAPARYAWHLYHEYMDAAGLQRGSKSGLWRLIMHYLRLWDAVAANRVDHFIANSHWIAANVWRAYRREADVIYPPVSVEAFDPKTRRGSYYVTVGRLAPYKRVDILVKAFAELQLPLNVIGDGPELRRLRRIAPRNVELMGWQPTDALRSLLSGARAFVYAAVEDFGIAPVEAQAAGCPVIAYGRGGAGETVIDGKTGILYPEQSVEALIRAVRQFEEAPDRFRVEDLRHNAERFGRDRFVREFRAYVEQKWNAFHTRGGGDR